VRERWDKISKWKGRTSTDDHATTKDREKKLKKTKEGVRGRTGAKERLKERRAFPRGKWDWFIRVLGGN